MDGGPQVQEVAVYATGGVEVLADVLAEVDGKGPRAIAGSAVCGTGTAFLCSAAAQRVQEA
jgi:hypothetical protein